MILLTRLMQPLNTMASSLLDFLMPWRCMICYAVLPSDTLWHYICQRCFDQLEPAPPPHHLLAAFDRIHQTDESAISHIIGRWSAHHERRPGLFDLVYALKYYGYWQIGIELGRELGAATQLLSTTRYDGLVPVPIHPARRRERGYNQAEAIAEGMQQVLHIPIWRNALCRMRYTRSQTTLSSTERMVNTRGAFGAGPDSTRLRGKTILIVDDVFTTGSTLNSVAMTALQLGTARADAATLVVATL
ncbi:MAG: phosphoribosyltransferase family protein [Chlorobi bacterium]|nr:phosphoribosyltransferase family protein [Chlorobiota bacterium]